MSEIDHRYQCVVCSRKRKVKFLYLIRLPFVTTWIRVCMDCFHKLNDKIIIEESAEADPRKVAAV